MRSSLLYTMTVTVFVILHFKTLLIAASIISNDRQRNNKVHTLDVHHHPIQATPHDAISTRFVTYDALNKDTYIKESTLPTTVDQLVKGGTIGQNASILLPMPLKSHHDTSSHAGNLSSSRTKEIMIAAAESRKKKQKTVAIAIAGTSRFDAAWDLHVGWVENAKSDSEFLLEIGVGTPYQKFLASIDTASPLTWLYTAQCCFPGNHSFFKPSHSSTFTNRTLNKYNQPVIANKGVDAQSYKLQYGGVGSGSIDTSLGFDIVNILPSTRNLTITNQTIGLVQSITNAKRGQGRDLRRMEAILGLSPGNGSAMPGKLHTPIEQLILDGAIEEPMFTVSFVKANGTKIAKGGRLILGGFDHQRMTGNVTWINSTSNLFWGFEFDHGAMKYGNIDIWPAQQPRRVIIDTGSSGIYLPSAAAKIVNEAILGSHYDTAGSRWLIPCKTGTLPHEKSIGAIQRARYFSINLNGKIFATPTIDLVLFPSNPIDINLDSNKSQMCNSAVQGGSEHFAVLGNTFIKNHAITFKYGGKDLTNRQIGFAHRSDTGIDLQTSLHVASPPLQPNDSSTDDC